MLPLSLAIDPRALGDQRERLSDLHRLTVNACRDRDRGAPGRGIDRRLDGLRALSPGGQWRHPFAGHEGSVQHDGQARRGLANAIDDDARHDSARRRRTFRGPSIGAGHRPEHDQEDQKASTRASRMVGTPRPAHGWIESGALVGDLWGHEVSIGWGTLPNAADTMAGWSAVRQKVIPSLKRVRGRKSPLALTGLSRCPMLRMVNDRRPAVGVGRRCAIESRTSTMASVPEPDRRLDVKVVLFCGGLGMRLRDYARRSAQADGPRSATARSCGTS